MTEQGPIERLGIELHDTVKELAKTGPAAYWPDNGSGAQVSVQYDTETDISKFTVLNWGGTLDMEVCEVNGSGEIVSALCWNLADTRIEDPLEDEGDEDPEPDEELLTEVGTSFLDSDDFWKQVRESGERARSKLQKMVERELAELGEESEDDEIELGDDFLEGVYERAERIRQLRIRDLMEAFEPDEEKMKEWRDLISSINSESDRLPE